MRRSIQSLQALVEAEDFHKIVRRINSPSNGYEHYYLAIAFRKLGYGRDAYAHSVLALRYDPANPSFQTELLNQRACYVPIEELEDLFGHLKSYSKKNLWFNPNVYSFSNKELNQEVVALLVRERQLYLSDIDLNLNAWEHQLNLDISGISSATSISSNGTLDNLIGYEGMRSPTLGKLVEYIQFLNNLNFFDNHPTILIDKLSKDEIWNTDLGTLVDLALIESSLTSGDKKKIIFEIGGGYGRLAEGVYQFCKESIGQYVLIDAIPGSLAAAHEYLSKHCPDWKIQLLKNGDPLDSESRVVICPSWNIAALDALSPDVVINIESIQEMSKAYERFWVDWVNSKINSNSVVYWSNSRSYKNKGDWYLPESWVLNLISETPRSWSSDHFTALFSLDQTSIENIGLKQLYATWKISTFTAEQLFAKILKS
jgi:hypothetical protein